MYKKNQVISIVLVLVIIIGAFIVALSSGVRLWLMEEGVRALFSSEVMGVPLTCKMLANVSVFVLLPVMMGGMLMALYRWSVDSAMKVFNAAGLIVSFIGGTLNYFFTLAIYFLSY